MLLYESLFTTNSSRKKVIIPKLLQHLKKEILRKLLKELTEQMFVAKRSKLGKKREPCEKLSDLVTHLWLSTSINSGF